MPISRSIMKWLLAIAMLLPGGFAGCGPGVRPYGGGHNEPVILLKGEAAPFAGWLLSTDDLEFLLKSAQVSP